MSLKEITYKFLYLGYKMIRFANCYSQQWIKEKKT